MRADALKNHEKILEVAAQVFSERGLDAPIDDIATRAGVGAGTLYRHFPTRDDLIDAVVKSWMNQVDATADDVVASDLPPREALLSWFDAYVTRISRNKGGPAKITGAMGNADSPIYTKCETLRAANERVLGSLRERGELRSDIDSLEVCRLVGAVAVVADQGGLPPESVRSMLNVVIDGLLNSPS
ncbi:MAG: TetR/AcrR family transcriptional regulator [Acidobacteria bacterium]|nr:TetR/AcrR family transcriptional regulator [Acidobacteriota bacterium]